MRQESFFARQLHEDLAARRAREQGGDDLEIEDFDARAETTADKRLDDADLRLVQFEAARQREVQIVDDLRDVLHRQAAAHGIEFRQAGVRFDLRVVDLRACHAMFADEIGRRKSGVEVAEIVVHFAFDVAGLFVVQQRGVRRARVLRFEIGRQFLEFDLDEIERALRGFLVDGRHRGDRFAAIAHALARQRIFVHRDRQHAVSETAVGAGDDCGDAIERARFRHVDTDDLGMRDRRPKDAADERAVAVEIGGVERTPRHFVDAVDQRNALATGPRFVDRAHADASAACRTDSMIFT